ncbi:MAG: AAA family ATPase [Bacteroidota bacterium]
MLDDLFLLSQNFLEINNRKYVRYFLRSNRLNNRFSIIIGQRGIGKTTIIIQYILSKYKQDIFTNKAIYVQADHFMVRKYSLYEIAEVFSNYGGELICFDEIHKYHDWSMELKSINDTFPELKIIASGSSAIEISKGTHDLSRRAIVYKLNGVSFREFVELSQNLEFMNYTIEDIVQYHQDICNSIIRKLDKKNKKVLPLFKKYLQYGYYPYYLEYGDKKLFYLTLEQNVHTVLESDLLTIYPHLTGNSVKKIKKLLSVIASSVPFTPDLQRLKIMLDIGDQRTLKNYFKYLEDAGIIAILNKGGKGLKELEKPDKIYLNNTNLMYALQNLNNAETGNIRETFFINMAGSKHKVSTPEKGDFLVDNKYIFEVGGRNKDFRQIKNLKNSYLALDDIEIGIGNKIPLWLFGFLY